MSGCTQTSARKLVRTASMKNWRCISRLCHQHHHEPTGSRLLQPERCNRPKPTTAGVLSTVILTLLLIKMPPKQVWPSPKFDTVTPQSSQRLYIQCGSQLTLAFHQARLGSDIPLPVSKLLFPCQQKGLNSCSYAPRTNIDRQHYGASECPSHRSGAGELCWPTRPCETPSAQ